ncbi:MAG: hypothetical protein AB7U82_34990, partial [Blastocatellales bacterium]
ILTFLWFAVCRYTTQPNSILRKVFLLFVNYFAGKMTLQKPWRPWRENLTRAIARAYSANRASGRCRVRGKDCVLLILITTSHNFDELFSARSSGHRAQ